MKKRIWIRRKDRVKQRYWVGRKLRKNYGSKMFSEQIKKEVFSGPDEYIINLSRLKKIEKTDPKLKGSKFIEDPRIGSKILLRTIEKHPDMLKDLRGKDIFFYEPKDEKTPHGFFDDRTIIGINKRVIATDSRIHGLDPLTKTRKFQTLKDILKHESTHNRQKKMSPIDQKELGANLAMQTNIRKENINKELLDDAITEFFDRIEDTKNGWN